MEKKTVMERINNIVISQLSVEPSKVRPEANFTEDLGADSLDIVELILSLEEEFDIEIPDELASEISTIQEAATIIAKKLGHTDHIPHTDSIPHTVQT
jgi:acyl carrier protein